MQKPERILMKGVAKLTQIVSMLAIVALARQANVDAATADKHARSAKVLLGVFAHPDDETTCAGVLARAAAGGWEVRVIFATSGDAGSDVSGRNLKGAVLGKEREREGACSLATLGVKRPPIWLGFGDGTLARARLQVKERLANELGGLKPDVIVSFGPEGITGHADHIAVGKATDEAAREAAPGSAVYHVVLGRQLKGWARVVGIAIPKEAKLPENLVTVDVSRFQSQRLASEGCHKTQWSPRTQAKLRDFHRAYPFEEFVWSGGGFGAPGKWVGP